MDFSNIEETIKKSKKILILPHINPDGDSLGSMLGLYSAIYDNLKKKCDMLISSHAPANYSFLPYFNLVKKTSDKSLIYDLVITVDVAAIERTGDAKTFFDKAENTINIDHHKTNIGFGKCNYIVPDASSTGEILFNILKNLNWKISKNTAECLYAAILTDTGGFRFDNTSKEVFSAVSELTACGAEPNKIYTHCYELKPKNFVLFQNHCLGKSIFLNDDKIAYTVVYRKDFEKYNADDDFTEGLTEQLRAIKSVDLAFIVKELDLKTSKISVRSKKYDSAKICSFFGGGGHSRAAGCTIKANAKAAAEKMLSVIKKECYEEKNG